MAKILVTGNWETSLPASGAPIETTKTLQIVVRILAPGVTVRQPDFEPVTFRDFVTRKAAIGLRQLF
jgi:hypothetical protein